MLSYRTFDQDSDQSVERQELDELDRNFKSFIQPHLSDKESEDRDLVWEWEKFLFDKGKRARPSR